MAVMESYYEHNTAGDVSCPAQVLTLNPELHQQTELR
jgi:hypothetical protein